MSKIGKQPINLVNGVVANISNGQIKINGPKGSLEAKIPDGLDLKIEGDKIFVSILKKDRQTLSLWGTTAKIISNMILGVSGGWQKQLEIIGTGYRAEVRGSNLVLAVGYSHSVEITAPQNIFFKVDKNIITVSGIDKQAVGQIAAEIRKVRPPEPYKGKGIKYLNEIVRRKAGKAAKATV